MESPVDARECFTAVVPCIVQVNQVGILEKVDRA